MKTFLIKYKKPIVVTISLIVLQLIFGFDPKFTIINIIWLFLWEDGIDISKLTSNNIEEYRQWVFIDDWIFHAKAQSNF